MTMKLQDYKLATRRPMGQVLSPKILDPPSPRLIATCPLLVIDPKRGLISCGNSLVTTKATFNLNTFLITSMKSLKC